MDFKELTFTFQDGIILIEMNTADNRNTLGSTLLSELVDAFDLVKEEKDAKILILSGSGRTFSIGADIVEMETLNSQDLNNFIRKGQIVIQALMSLAIPTLAAVNGLALGGGFELALACDMRWAHKRAAFGFPECKHQLIPAWGGIQLLRLHAAPSLQTELLLSGDRLNAQTAYQIGLVTHLFEGRDFIIQVKDASQRFLSNDLHVLKAFKKFIARKSDLEKEFTETISIFHELWFDPNRKPED